MLKTEFAHTFTIDLRNTLKHRVIVEDELLELENHLEYFLYAADGHLTLLVTHTASTLGEAVGNVVDILGLECPNILIDNIRVVQSYTKAEGL